MLLLWQELKKHKVKLFLALFLASVNQVFSLLNPQIFRLMVDKYASRVSELSRPEFIKGILLLVLLSMIAALISRIAKAFQDYYLNVVTQRSGTNLYAKSVEHAFSLPFAVFEDNSSGEFLNKLQKARTDSQTLISNTVNILFFSLIGIIFVVSYAASMHWLIGLMFFAIIPIVGGTIFFLSKKIKIIQQAIVKETAALSGSTTETLRNVELVKSLGLESQEIDRLNGVNEKILGLELNKVKMVRKLDFVQGTLLNAVSAGIQFILFLFIFNGIITLGEYMTLWIYTFFVFEPLRMLGQMANSYQEATASLGQLEEIFKLKPASIPLEAKRLDIVQDIEYRDVSLSYGAGTKKALQDISIKIRAGETVAFVGPSGSGKSTMIKLLAGLYTPTVGDIYFNDINIKDLDINSLRKKIGLVAQETQLFAGTIRENLTFVKPDSTDEEMMRALNLAQAESILDKGDDKKGLNTRIGEGGVKLSGGEKQRLAIARALLRNPDLIVFDEATSSLDSITEKAITDTIKNINKETGKEISNKKVTHILVAHRLSTILHADRIYVFEKGQIIETGTHDELVEKAGLYAALWREQVGE